MLRRSDNSHGSNIHLTPYTFHSDCSVRFGQWGKNPAQAEAVRSFASFGRFSVKLLRVQTDRTVQQQDGGWLVTNGTEDLDTSWLVCSKTSQEIVSYWLLGGDASGLLWRCFKYDELPL